MEKRTLSPTEIMQERIKSAKSILDLVFSCQSDEIAYSLTRYDTIPANIELAATLMQNEKMSFIELLNLTGWNGKLLYSPLIVDSEIDTSKKPLIKSLWEFIADQVTCISDTLYIVPLHFDEYPFLSWKIAEIKDETLPYRFKDHKRYTKIVILSPNSYVRQKRKHAKFVSTYKLDRETWRALQVNIVKCETYIKVESAYFSSNTQVDITVNGNTNVEVIGKSLVIVRIMGTQKSISVFAIPNFSFYFIQDPLKTPKLPF